MHGVVYWSVLCYHPYPVSLLFADLLSLTSCYIFNVFYYCSCHFFLAADACLSWSLPSITEQQVCPHRLPQRCMQYCLKNHWPDQAFCKHSLHTNCISNSAILHNNHDYILLLMHTHEVKKGLKSRKAVRTAHGRTIASFVTPKQWVGALLSGKCMLLFCAKTNVKESHKFELPCLKEK